jgi:hypothetical protein
MNKRYVSFVIPIMLSLGTPVFAQSHFGIVSGLNYMSLTGYLQAEDGTETDFGYKVGFSFGAFFSFQIAPRIAFRPEICYTRKGAKVDEPYGLPNVQRTYNYDYLEIPLLGEISLGSGNPSGIKLIFGPAISFMLRERIHDETPAGTQTFKTDITKVDFGGIAGLSVGLLKKQHSPFLEAKYYVGVVDTEDYGQ